jgi:transposase-like protein
VRGKWIADSVVSPESWTGPIVHLESVRRGKHNGKATEITPEFKAQVVLEELTGVRDKAEICREYRLSRQVSTRWRAEFVDWAPEIFATERSRGDEQERIAELERMIGRLTMELEMSEEASGILTSLSNGRWISCDRTRCGGADM